MMAIVTTSEPINAQTLLVYSPSHHRYVHIYIYYIYIYNYMFHIYIYIYGPKMMCPTHLHD